MDINGLRENKTVNSQLLKVEGFVKTTFVNSITGALLNWQQRGRYILFIWHKRTVLYNIHTNKYPAEK
jgi:hypothetical protein